MEELANRLARAEAERRTIPQLVHDHPQLDVKTAYEIQRVGFEARLGGANIPIGYKIGLSSRAKQESMGVHEPIRGRLSSSMLHPQDVPLRLSTLIHPRVEAEIAFFLQEPIEGAGANVASVLRATGGIFPALEILDSRYDDFKFTLPDAVSDNCSAARIVIGGRLVPPHQLDMVLEGMVLRVDGDIVHTAAGAAVSEHPAAAVAWLAQAVGMLDAGDIIMSGGLSAAVPLAGKRSVIAEYTNLGSVSLQID